MYKSEWSPCAREGSLVLFSIAFGVLAMFSIGVLVRGFVGWFFTRVWLRVLLRIIRVTQTDPFRAIWARFMTFFTPILTYFTCLRAFSHSYLRFFAYHQLFQHISSLSLEDYSQSFSYLRFQASCYLDWRLALHTSDAMTCIHSYTHPSSVPCQLLPP